MPDTETETKPKKGAAAAQTETETKPKKAEGWDRSLRHYGVFTDFRQREFPAYMEFNDVDDPKKRGWQLFCAATRKEFKPGTVFLHPEHLSALKLKFVLNGETDSAAKAPKGKIETKSARNKRMAAAAPKEEDAE